MKMSNNMDMILSQLEIGKWHVFHILAVGYATGLTSPHALAGAFITPRLRYRCASSPNVSDDFDFSNDTESTDWCRSGFSTKPEEGDTEDIHPCSQWEYDDSTFTSTLTSEFNLVCEKDYLRATYQSMYMIGVLFGSAVNGIIADKYGRKFTFVGSYVLYTFTANVSCWLPNLFSILVFRFLLGTMHTAILKTGFILVVENVNPKVRSLVGVFVFLPWGLGTMAWGGLAYLLRTWRYLLMTASLPFLLLIPALWFLDESPRWLIVHGHHEKALQTLKRAARWNKTTLPPDEEIWSLVTTSQESKVLKSQENVKNHSWRATFSGIASDIMILFRTPRVRLASIVMILDYMVLGMVYFGLSLGGSNFNFNTFAYMALTGLMELPAYTVMAPIIQYFGCKMSVAICYLVSGMILLIQPFLPSEMHYFALSSALIGKMAISMAFQGNNLYATELFPTEVRTRGVSSSFMASRIGSALAPFITEYLGMIYPWAPSVVFGIAAAIAGLATLTLWETEGSDLPDTVVQLESQDFKLSKRLANI